MPYPVVHFQIEGLDGAALRSFYAELFGWQTQDPFGPAEYAVLPSEAVSGAPMTGAISQSV